MIQRSFILLAFPFALLAEQANAQMLLYEFKDNFATGTKSDVGSDFNHDGFPDLLVGSYSESQFGNLAGAVRVYSGFDRSVLALVYNSKPLSQLGRAVSFAGDVDHDGVVDFLASELSTFGSVGHNSGRVSVFSGATGVTLFEFDSLLPFDEFGASIDGGADVNDDGTPDFLIGAYAYNSPGSESGVALAYSGADGSLLFAWPGNPSERQGYAVSFAGDVDGDGHADVLVGAPKYGGSGGRALLYSGSTGALLHPFFGGPPSSGDFGFCVADLGDLDGDGVDDLGVGSPNSTVNGPFAGLARVYSGATFTLLYEYSKASTLLGYSMAPAGDYDGDGANDFVLTYGLQAFPEGSIAIHSGATGQILESLMAPPGISSFLGSQAKGGFDVNLDGRPDLMVDYGGGNEGWGRLWLTGFNHPTTYCSAKLNSQFCAPAIDFSGTPNTLVGTDSFKISASQVINQQIGVLLLGRTSAALPFGGGTLCVGPPIHRVGGLSSGGTSGPANCTGALSFHLSQAFLAATGLVPGDLCYAQFWYRDPDFMFGAKIGLTDAVAFQVAQ